MDNQFLNFGNPLISMRGYFLSFGDITAAKPKVILTLLSDTPLRITGEPFNYHLNKFYNK
jgi:hypothetical protein